MKKSNFKKSYLAKIFLLSLSLGLLFSAISGIILNNAGIVVAIFVIVFFVALSIVADIVGVAITSCEAKMFLGLKEIGAREAMYLSRHSDKVSSIMCDVIGDICGILSGCGCSAVVLKLFVDGSKVQVICSIVFSAFIAALTIFGKAVGKNYAILNNKKIAIYIGKILNKFLKKSKPKK